MLLSDLPRFELAKRWKIGFLATPPLFIWKCMNPTLLPCILSGGTYSSTLWAVHPCTQGFELILGHHYLPQTQKTSFFPLFLVSWGMNNNFTTTQNSILWRWDHGTAKPEEKVGGHHASFWAAEARTCKMVENGFFWPHPPCSYDSVWIPPCCPVYYQGEHILQLYGLYTHVHRDSSWFWDVIICHKPKKRHFSHFSLSPGAGIIILQPPKAAFCEGGTMAHQNLKRKWGVTMLLSQLPRLELAKRGENGIFPHTPHLFMLCVSPSFSILCNSGSASVSTSLHFSQV